MKKETFRQKVNSKILVLDGVFGSLLQSHLSPGACIDMVNLESPDLIAGICSDYVNAGADIISTNTFGANRIKLNEFGFGDKIKEINHTAAQIANKSCPNKWVAGVIGPTGKLVEPLGPLTFDETYQTFKEQAVALANGGVDLFLLETFSDLREIKIAVMAIKENTDLPILAAMTFGEDYLTFTGTNPETAANVLVSLGVDAVGVNCSTGPEPMLEVVGRYLQTTDIPIFVEPNAGLPRLQKGKATYQISPQAMAEFGSKFIDIGVNIFGTCCGSTPEYTAQLHSSLKGRKPVTRKSDQLLRLSSRAKTVAAGQGLPFCIIGERINPTNRDDLIQALKDSSFGMLQKEAQNQEREGAHLIDINIGTPGIDEIATMEKAVQNIENVVTSPLVFDSSSSAVIEAGLRMCSGKPLINSVYGSPQSMDEIIPLAARYGAGLLCLAVGEKGIPKTAEERVRILETIIDRAQKAGIPRNHLICDGLTLTVSAQQNRAEETLKTIRMIKEKLQLPTVLGVSNISYGLPERSLVNAIFLGMAMSAGLDAAIMNPGDSKMMETVRAASVLTVRDKDSREFVKGFTSKRKKKKEADKPPVIPEQDQQIMQAVIDGNRDEIERLVQDALDSKVSPSCINNDMLVPAIQEVGKQYDRKDIFLPQMILAAETMQRAFSILEPYFQKGDVHTKGTVLICTVQGDVHDIGKNIVGLFMKNQGFHVLDLGKDVSSEVIVKEAKNKKADMVGLSALMTTTMGEMPKVIQALKDSGSPAKVLVGGAVVTKQFAKEIGADGYAKDGVSAAEMAVQLITN